MRKAVFAILAAAGIAGALVIYGPDLGARLGLMPRFASIGACPGDGVPVEPAEFATFEPGGTIVGLAASGGGSRAAYLAAAILREMRASGLRFDGGDPQDARSLIDQLDLVSAVSGGSLAAAYLVVHGGRLRGADAVSPEWQTFLDDMAINYRLRQWYAQAATDPRIWAKYLFSNYHRGLLARDDYDGELFKSVTLADLPDRPALYINSFDVGNHVRFVLSRHEIDTWFYQPRDAWGKLSAPQELTSENDLSFLKLSPRYVRIADAVGASSAFPFAYPNVALRHCGNKILFQGRHIFLSDGALADNSGLITLFTQVRAAVAKSKGPHKIVAISIDATTDRLDTNGSRFQQRGDEEVYAWRDTVVGHGVQSIESAVSLMQDLGWRFLESTGVETDQINANWALSLPKRTGTCLPPSRSTWANMFEDGRLPLRPLIIRLGLRDVMNPDFEGQYGAYIVPHEDRLLELARLNGIGGDWTNLRTELRSKLARIATDFALTDEGRHALDLAAFLLVQGKLAADVAAYNAVAQAAKPRLPEGFSCPDPK